MPNLFVMPATKQSIHKVIHSDIHRDIHRTIHTHGPRADLAPSVVVASLPPTMMKNGPRNHNLLGSLFPPNQAAVRLASRFTFRRVMIRRGCNCGRFPVGPEPFRTVRSVSICCTARRIGFHQFRPLPDTPRLGLFCAPRGHVLEGRSQVAELVQRRHYGELLNVMLGRLGVSQPLPKDASG